VSVYREGVRIRLHAADLVAILVLAVLVGGLGTGLGVAAARVRGSEGPRQGPLRAILHGGPEAPSIQRDRIRLNKHHH
jgi:hypothetical protein